MTDEERTREQVEGQADQDEGQSAEELKRDFESDPATNPEKTKEDPFKPEGLRGG